ncbi:hypothetical protein IT407_04370 [Candidatus Uhrbacteria bacterium]|nr:hypothetical protein [Candidatus Uhrbacteria bacterium]
MKLLKNAYYGLGAGMTVAGSMLPLAAMAQRPSPFGSGGEAGKLLNDTGRQAGVGDADLTVIVGNIINIVLGFLGIVLLFYLLLAGWTWMSAGGDSKKVDEAKTMIRNAIIGLVIIVASYAIANFVITQLANITT